MGVAAVFRELVRSGGATPEPEQGDATSAYSRARTMANEANHPFTSGPSPSNSRGPSPSPRGAGPVEVPSVGLAMIIKQREEAAGESNQAVGQVSTQSAHGPIART